MKTPYPEWGEPATGGPVRQGDVLAALSASADPWHQLVVVITADCDLAHAKHGGSLTCIPIIPLTHYLLHFRIERTRESLQWRIIDAILDCINEPEGAGSRPHISRERMCTWIAEEGVEEVMTSLTKGDHNSRLHELLIGTQTLVRFQESTLSHALDCLASIKVLLRDARDEASARNKIADDLASALNKLPGDTLLLNEVSAVHNEGYVAYLRRVVELADESVATSFSRIPGDAQYLRISRLRSPYIYALTQQFAAVFSAIGLPTPYEEARDFLSARIKAGDY